MEQVGSANVQRKEGECLVKEHVVGVILECETHKIRDEHTQMKQLEGESDRGIVDKWQ